MKAVTINHIATNLQMSPSTVSRALRNSHLIQPQTRARVVNAAMKMGYKGKSLRARQTQSVGKRSAGLVFASETMQEVHGSSNSEKYLEGVTLEADALDVLITIHAIRGVDRGRLGKEEKVPSFLKRSGCDFLIFQGRHVPEDVVFLSKQVPCVSLNMVYPSSTMDLVISDNRAGILRLMDLLVSTGHRKPCWIGDFYPASFFEERLAGFIQGCLHHNLPLDQRLILGENLYRESQMNSARLSELVKRHGVDAFVCANDHVAYQVIRESQKLGLKIPKDVSVTGFDHARAEMEGVALTTIDPNFVEMGRHAVRLGMQRLERLATNPITVNVQSKMVLGQTHRGR